MTSKSMLFCLLDSKPDAKGTVAYLYVLSKESMVWSVFHEILAPVDTHYTLSNNFINRNAYMCIELNAHAVH